jgi:hypothetical protein
VDERKQRSGIIGGERRRIEVAHRFEPRKMIGAPKELRRTVAGEQLRLGTRDDLEGCELTKSRLRLGGDLLASF